MTYKKAQEDFIKEEIKWLNKLMPKNIPAVIIRIEELRLQLKKIGEKEHNPTTIRKDSDSYLSKDMVKIEDVNKIIDKFNIYGNRKYNLGGEQIDFIISAYEFKQSLKELGEK